MESCPRSTDSALCADRLPFDEPPHPTRQRQSLTEEKEEEKKEEETPVVTTGTITTAQSDVIARNLDVLQGGATQQLDQTTEEANTEQMIELSKIHNEQAKIYAKSLRDWRSAKSRYRFIGLRKVKNYWRPFSPYLMEPKVRSQMKQVLDDNENVEPLKIAGSVKVVYPDPEY